MTKPIKDAKEREEALDPRHSYIVQAPAGSGKTELLIQRFLRLLSMVEQPEQILAMTFTRKAAGEMKARIQEALQLANSGIAPEQDYKQVTYHWAREILKRNSEKSWHLLENPNRLKIQTIDSFCAYLLGRMPLLSQRGGALSLNDKPYNLYRESARRLLKEVESSSPETEAIRSILLHLDNAKSSFLEKLTALFEKRDQWMTPFFNDFELSEDTRTFFEKSLEGLVLSKLQLASDLVPEEEKRRFMEVLPYAGRNVPETDELACLSEMKAFPEPQIAYLNYWRAIANIALKQDGNFRSTVDKRKGFPAKSAGGNPIKKEVFLSILHNLSTISGVSEVFYSLSMAPDPQFSESEWTVLKSMLSLMPKMESILRQVFRERGCTDFSELAISARSALGTEDNPTDLMLYLDYKIQHILIDEFQDTSFKQCQLFQQLTEGWLPDDGRTLFIVGDPMQSIYRFRDAEVGLFLKTRDMGLGNIHLKFLQLKTNFRSQEKIVNWVNTCFQSVFPQKEERDLGAITYSNADSAPSPGSLEGVLYHPVPEGDHDWESRIVLEQIIKIRKTNPQDSIAILVRSRNHLQGIVRQFKENNIVFKAEEIDPLVTRPEIMDLVSFLRAFLSRDDRVAWLSILRAPWCGLSLEDLAKLCENSEDASIWSLLNDSQRIQQLSEEGKIKCNRVVEIIAKAQTALYQSPLDQVLKGCWLALGGPACIDQAQQGDVDLFFDQVATVVRDDDLEALYRFDQVLDKLFASPTVSDPNPVQIMTMHKAKGLEFDHVFLPGLGRKPRGNTKRLVYWTPFGETLLIAPIQETGSSESRIYDFLQLLDKEKEAHEIVRLLYVSTTRAKKQLHLLGDLKEKEGKAPRPQKGTLLEKLWPSIGETWIDYYRQLDIPKTPNILKNKSVPTTFQLPGGFELPGFLLDLTVDDSIELQLNEESKPEFIWAGNQARCIGNVLHRWFCDYAGKELPEPENLPKDELKQVLSSALLSEGLPESQLVQSVNKCLKAIQNALEDDTGRWIMQTHKDHRSEYALTRIQNGQFKERVIDRTFIDENNERWIIDFKTGEHQGANLSHFFSEESDRYRNQLTAYKELLKLKGETRTIRLALYYPMHQKLVEIH